MLRRYFALVFCVVTLFASPAIARRNVVADYLAHADRQYENDQQRGEIVEALQDMIRQPIRTLRAKRYRDYEGRTGLWSLPELVRRYFVPARPRIFSNDEFFRDLHRPPAPKVIRDQLRSLQGEGPL